MSAIIVNYEGGRHLLDCLHSLQDQPGLAETIVVDNGSTDGSAAAARERFPGTVLVEPEANLGFAGGANAGARVARGRLLLFLNPDVELEPGAVERLAAAFGRADVGVAGPKLELDRLGAVEVGATVDPLGYPVPLASTGRPPLYVSGCALMTPGELFAALDGFDERFFMFVEDVDYCWRALLRGFDVRVVPDAVVRHYGGASAHGGYVADGRLATTAFRVALRERNTLAMLLKCYAGPTLAAVLPLYVAQTVATAAALAAAGRTRTAGAILRGLVWNAHQLSRTLALRREIQAARAVGERKVISRMHRSLQKLALLRRVGLPEVADEHMAGTTGKRVAS